MKCQICGHDIDEHGKEGCYHLEYKDLPGVKDALVSCDCEASPTDIYKQKGNQ